MEKAGGKIAQALHIELEVRHGAKSHISAYENTAILWRALTRWTRSKRPCDQKQSPISRSHKTVSDDSECLTRRAVARKRRLSQKEQKKKKRKEKKKKKDLRWARVQVAILEYKLAICSDCIQIPESGAPVRHDSNWKLLWAAPEKPPVLLLRQVSQGSVFCIAPQFAFLPQIFRATGSAARNQRALHGSIVRAPPFPKQYARGRNRWKP